MSGVWHTQLSRDKILIMIICTSLHPRKLSLLLLVLRLSWNLTKPHDAGHQEIDLTLMYNVLEFTWPKTKAVAEERWGDVVCFAIVLFNIVFVHSVKLI